MSEGPLRTDSGRWVPFAYGFRPFFLLAGWYAIIAAGAWLSIYGAGWAGPRLPAGHFWHGHEMIFGFAVCAVAGFLLTAVPSWTASRGFGGPPLVVLTLIWLFGRFALAASTALPWPLVAVAELAFLPALALFVAPPLVRSRNRNRPLLILMLGLWIADAVFLAAAQSGNGALAGTALLAALDILLLLITIIGGRIVPSFTANALKRRGIEIQVRRYPILERSVVTLMTAVILGDLLGPAGHPVVGLLAGVAGLAQVVRLVGWHGFKSLREPIVWVLHAAYAWLPLGLLLKAVFLLAGAGWAAFWLHALSLGAASTMVLAVMSRAALGHTGRTLQVSTAMAGAYALLIMAGLVRVFGPAIAPLQYRETVLLAGAFWIGAWTVYAWKYTPILVRPRVDGKPG